jgi:hypothetical protein
MLSPRVRVRRGKIEEVCLRHGIRRLALFGSVLREDFGSQSDIDVLVEFEPGRTPGFVGLAALEEELGRLFGGRKVDVRTPGELSKYFREEVLKQAEVQYAKE